MYLLYKTMSDEDSNELQQVCYYDNVESALSRYHELFTLDSSSGEIDPDAAIALIRVHDLVTLLLPYTENFPEYYYNENLVIANIQIEGKFEVIKYDEGELVKLKIEEV
jgi:hypothetical protein